MVHNNKQVEAVGGCEKIVGGLFLTGKLHFLIKVIIMAAKS
jgi:hypothetical protein